MSKSFWESGFCWRNLFFLVCFHAVVFVWDFPSLREWWSQFIFHTSVIIVILYKGLVRSVTSGFVRRLMSPRYFLASNGVWIVPISSKWHFVSMSMPVVVLRVVPSYCSSFWAVFRAVVRESRLNSGASPPSAFPRNPDTRLASSLPSSENWGDKFRQLKIIATVLPNEPSRKGLRMRGRGRRRRARGLRKKRRGLHSRCSTRAGRRGRRWCPGGAAPGRWWGPELGRGQLVTGTNC